MTREWQEAANERLKELGIEPISGPGGEGYKVHILWLYADSRAKAWFTETLSTGKIVKFNIRKTEETKF